MVNNTSPLETLAAFAIVFVAGALSTALLGSYIGKLRQAAHRGAASHGA